MWSKNRSNLVHLRLLRISANHSPASTGVSNLLKLKPVPALEINMKSFIKWIGVILAAVLVGLVMVFVYAAIFRAQINPASALSPLQSSTQFPLPKLWNFGPGMMRRQGGSGSYAWGMGPGMMGGSGPGTWGQSNPGTITPLSLDQAIEAAEQFLSDYGNADLALAEVMEFTNNFYAEVEEKSTGVHAFELLIDRYTGTISPEPGPNMMWNTRYSPMAGMMGGWGRRSLEDLSVTPDGALEIARQWLDKNLPGTSADTSADAFYGYYTIHVMNDDQVYGMLSVNGYTGDVWYHDWHGEFIGMQELEEE